MPLPKATTSRNTKKALRCRWCTKYFMPRSSRHKVCGSACRQAIYRTSPSAHKNKNVQTFRRLLRRLLFVADQSRCQIKIESFGSWIAQVWDDSANMSDYKLPQIPEGYLLEFCQRLALMSEGLPPLQHG